MVLTALTLFLSNSSSIQSLLTWQLRSLQNINFSAVTQMKWMSTQWATRTTDKRAILPSVSQRVHTICPSLVFQNTVMLAKKRQLDNYEVVIYGRLKGHINLLKEYVKELIFGLSAIYILTSKRYSK